MNSYFPSSIELAYVLSSLRLDKNKLECTQRPVLILRCDTNNNAI